MMRIHTAKEIGLLIKDRRREQGLTQEALAARVGATRQWVRALESGKPRLELGLTLRALTALGVRLDAHVPDAHLPPGGAPHDAALRRPRPHGLDLRDPADLARRASR